MQKVSPARRRSLDFTGLFKAQLGTTFAIMALAAALVDGQAALDALMGGLVSLLPGLYFVWRGLYQRPGQFHRQGVMTFYQAAAGKFGLTVALFVTVFILVPPSNPAFFFIAYAVAQLMNWLNPWLVCERSTP